MSKRRAWSSTEHGGDGGCTCAAKRSRALPQPKQRHLYVALDDRDKAYSVYRLDVDGADEQRRLPEPPVLRLEVAKRGAGDSCLFAALGTKIVAMSTDRSPTLVHDTATSGLAIGHRPPRALSRTPFLTVAAAGRLHALPPRFTEDMYYLEEEAPPPPPEEVTSPDSISDDEDEMTRHMYYQRTSSSLDDLRADKWMWNTVDSRSPVPFEPGAVVCHAVHPDGHTIFVSVQRRRDTWTDHGTFSLDASRHGAGEWTRHGDWVLPFEGQAFFEGQLDAWVGLNEHGHICSCDGVSRSESRRAAPAKKVGKETLLREADRDRRLDAALAHMGDGRFCLVERAAREGSSKARHGSNGEQECVLHVTTFAVRYDKHGDLTVADRRHAGSYAVSTHDRLFKLQAFFV